MGINFHGFCIFSTKMLSCKDTGEHLIKDLLARLFLTLKILKKNLIIFQLLNLHLPIRKQVQINSKILFILFIYLKPA